MIPGILDTTGYIDLKDLTPDEFSSLIFKKLGMNIEIDELLTELRDYFVNYDIDIKDETIVTFDSPSEQFYTEYPLSILLHMNREDWLYNMFFFLILNSPSCLTGSFVFSSDIIKYN